MCVSVNDVSERVVFRLNVPKTKAAGIMIMGFTQQMAHKLFSFMVLYRFWLFWGIWLHQQKLRWKSFSPPPGEHSKNAHIEKD